jgi:hypothetical protein
MTCPSCGCPTLPCGCCDGTRALTPRDLFNRPGLPALDYRVGTHGAFLQTMLARLSTMAVDGMSLDGQPLTGLRPLQALTTRDPGDPSIAMLDAWATVGDVLGFYQERIANECYLRTAIERRSVLELAKLVGYTLRPGVAASTWMAYTIDDHQVEPTVIPTGTRTQSVPDPGETAQAFETIEDLPARREWNNLQVRLAQPQVITLDNVLTLASLQVAGTATQLKAGDPLLFVFAADGSTSALRVVDGVDTQFADSSSAVRLRAVPPITLGCAQIVMAFVAKITLLLPSDTTGLVQSTLNTCDGLLGAAYLGSLVDPSDWRVKIERAAGYPTALGELHDDVADVGDALGGLVVGGRGSVTTTTTSEFAVSLLKASTVQPRNSLQLPRSLGAAFLPPGVQVGSELGGGGQIGGVNGGGLFSRRAARTFASAGTTPSFAPVYADVSTQLLFRFAPELQRTYYAAWAGASLNPSESALIAVHALRARASLFGATASRLPTYSTANLRPDLPHGTLLPPNQWGDWTYGDAGDETSENAFLDQSNENVAAESYVLAELDGVRQVMRVSRSNTHPRSAYGLSGPSTELVFGTPGDDGASSWRTFNATDEITALRKTQLWVQSEPLTLVDQPLTDPIGPQDETDDVTQVTLDGLYDGLTSGRWVIFEGERDDIGAVAGVTVAELQMVSGLSHSYDTTVAGDTVHTTLLLAKRLAFRYKRSTLVIHGNVAKATHGQTRDEVLGSGDGSQDFATFTLKQPPLTFIAAPTAAGAATTLVVRVNGVAWNEVDSLAWLGPKDAAYVTQTADDGTTSVTFGDGVHGARLPSGVQNVVATYRNGLGPDGNVKAGQLTLLQTRPLGVRAVTNPLAASGGAGAEARDLARENAPLSVQALDRLVSVGDYAAFARRFAGIAKATALRTSDGHEEIVHVTIAGVDDVPIPTTSDLYVNLLAGLRDAGDADLPLRVDLRELKVLVMSANLKLLDGYVWETVVAAVRASLLDAFGFDRRALGQPALLSEVIAAMQAVPGIDYVDVDAFGAVAQDAGTASQQVVGEVATVPSQDAIVDAIAAIVNPVTIVGQPTDVMPRSVPAWPGGVHLGVLRPAQLVIFVPDVADTLVLNQIP